MLHSLHDVTTQIDNHYLSPPQGCPKHVDSSRLGSMEFDLIDPLEEMTNLQSTVMHYHNVLYCIVKSYRPFVRRPPHLPWVEDPVTVSSLALLCKRILEYTVLRSPPFKVQRRRM